MDASNVLIKQMPMSVEAEQAVLGSIIIKPESFDDIGGVLVANDFYLEDHQRIYTTLLKMYGESKIIDTVTLVNSISDQNGKDKESTIQYITLLAESVPSVANIKDYARIVKEKSVLVHNKKL